jgi:hypothetical protein
MTKTAMTKTTNADDHSESPSGDCGRFGHSRIDAWNLFGIWCLGFGISGYER